MEVKNYKYYEAKSVMKSEYYFPVYNANYGFIYLNVTVSKDDFVTVHSR